MRHNRNQLQIRRSCAQPVGPCSGLSFGYRCEIRGAPVALAGQVWDELIQAVAGRKRALAPMAMLSRQSKLRRNQATNAWDYSSSSVLPDCRATRYLERVRNQ